MDEQAPEDQGSAEEEFFDRDLEQEADPMGIGRRVAERSQAGRSRSLIMFVVFVVFVGVLTFLLFDDLVYFFAPTTPVELGQAENLATQSLAHNSFVRITGIARDMCIRAEVMSSRMRFLYMLGSEMGGRILVQSPDPDKSGCLGAVERSFEGRLVDLTRSDRYEAVLSYYRERFPAAPRSGPVYLIEHEVRPREGWHFPLALLGLLALAVINFLVLRKRLKRDEGASGGTP